MQSPVDEDATQSATPRNRTVGGYRRSPSLLASFGFAYEGIVHAFRTQRNFRIHSIITLLVISAGIVLQLPLSEWEKLALVIALVLQTELTNTAVEALVDRVSPEYHELAKVAKDCSAAAVLVTSIAAVVVGVAIFGSRIVALLQPIVH